MLIESIVSQIGQLALAADSAKAGDLSTLADVLRQLETLHGAAKQPELALVRQVSVASSEVIKRIMMDMDPGTEQLLSAVRKAAHLMAKSAMEGKLPNPGDLPPELPMRPEPQVPASAGSTAYLKDEEILSEFLSRQTSVLQELEVHILALEKGPSADDLAGLLHILHTMKGDSGFLGLSGVEQLCHSAENYLHTASHPYDIETLLTVKDWLASTFAGISAGVSDNALPMRLINKLEGVASPQPPVAKGHAPAPPQPPSAPAAVQGPNAALEAAPVELEPPGDPVHMGADASLLAEFISESKEHLDAANNQLLALETEPSNKEALNSVFRAFHTMKGISGFLGLGDISHLAHDTENLLDRVRKEEMELSQDVMDISFEALDMMMRLIEDVKQSLESGAELSREKDLPGLLGRVRALATHGPKTDDRPKLGQLLVESGAVSNSEVNKALATQEQDPAARKLGAILVEEHSVAPAKVIQALQKQLPETEFRGTVQVKDTIRVDYERLENMINTIGEMVLAESMISQDEDLMRLHSEELGKKIYNLRMVTRKLQELGTTIRMVPIAGTFQKMARLVRDLSRKSGKAVNFQTRGDETELDRAFVDKIADPLVHMIRNAVDHGIETPEERLATNKPPEALIELRAFHEGGNIHVEIRDDGRGLNRQAIMSKAIEKGLVAPDAQMGDQEIFNLIFLPGFSTAKVVTEVSGRGVGMDVVKRNIEELRGYVQIFSEPGKGTKFKIILPLTLALIDGMVVRVGKERYIIPVLTVVESLRPSAEMVTTLIGKGEMVTLRNRQVPLFRVGNLFGIPQAEKDVTKSLVVVVEHEGKHVGLLVDELIGMQQTVIKTLGSGMGQTAGFSGGAIMADGRVGLIVDVAGVIKLARGSSRS
jgi:two-component system chemotaxis sensor kinase CheA